MSDKFIPLSAMESMAANEAVQVNLSKEWSRRSTKQYQVNATRSKSHSVDWQYICNTVYQTDSGIARNP